jgi:integrase
MRLTASAVKGLKLPAGRKEGFFWDTEVRGLAVRLRQGGRKTLIFQFRLNGQQGRVNFGNADSINISAARETAKKLYAGVKLGIDPRAERVRGRLEAAETFERVLAGFLGKQRGVLAPRSYAATERYLLQNARDLHRLPVSQITRRDIATVLATARETSGPIAANRLRSALGGFFAFAISEGLLDAASPVIGTTRTEETPRARVLLPAELRLVWHAAGDGDFGRIVRLMLLTAAREGEVGLLNWHEVDFDRQEIVLPPHRTKNRRGHVIPLSEPAARILRETPRRAGHMFVFGRLESRRGFSGFGHAKIALDQRLEAAYASLPAPELAALRAEWHKRGFDATSTPPAWRLHDIRRSVATLMADEIGIQPHVVESVLNHSLGSRVQTTYNRSTYSAEVRRALDAWGAWLTALVEGREQKVLAFRREA